MEQKLKAGAVVPPIRLPDAQGTFVEREHFRGKASLLILFLPGLSQTAQDYLQALVAEAASWERSERALVIAQATPEQLTALRAGPQVTLLADAEGKVRARYLPDEAAGGWFATDRYGELYAQGLIADAAELPPPAELYGWLSFIGCQCGG